MKLNDAIRGYALGIVPVDDLPTIALQALEDGYDSPSLCELAGTQGPEASRIRSLFSKALEELGLSVPSPADAGIAIARSIAKEVLDARITPYAGAKKIWTEVYTRFPELTELKVFVGCASEYEDDEKHRPEYDQMIIRACNCLLSEKNGENGIGSI